jgi:adenylate cyclase
LLGTRALASAAAIAETKCAARELGTFLLRGKGVPVNVYELRAGVDAADAAFDERFAHALGLFRTGRWDDARAAFSVLAAAFPEDGPTRFYTALAQTYASEPPRNWGGIVVITTK